MNFKALENNIFDSVRESITKLGYEAVPLTLYFPGDALRELLGENMDEDMLRMALNMFVKQVEDKLGILRISKSADGRFSITVPVEGVQYVNENMEPAELTHSLTVLLQEPDCDIMEIVSLFRANGSAEVRKSRCEDYDYMIFFPDGKPDDYRYCFHEEMGRMIYHRFTPAEFEKMFGTAENE